jgi:hypothetical protein
VSKIKDNVIQDMPFVQPVSLKASFFLKAKMFYCQNNKLLIALQTTLLSDVKAVAEMEL